MLAVCCQRVLTQNPRLCPRKKCTHEICSRKDKCVVDLISTRAISTSGELAVTSIASSNLSSVSLLTGTIPKPQRTIRSCALGTTERGTCFIARRATTSAGCRIWRSRLCSFRCARNPKAGPTKPDNTQNWPYRNSPTGSCVFAVSAFSNGQFN